MSTTRIIEIKPNTVGEQTDPKTSNADTNGNATLPQKDYTKVWTFFMSALALMCIIFLLSAYVINTISIYNGTEKVAGRKEATDIYLMFLFFPVVFFLLVPTKAFTKERFDEVPNLSGKKIVAVGRVLSRGAILMTICISLIGLYAISDLFSSFDERCTDDNKRGQEEEQQGIFGKLGSKPVILVCDVLESSVKGSRFVPFLISVVYVGLALATYYSLEQGGRESIDAFAKVAKRKGMRVAREAGSKAASAAGTAGAYVGKKVERLQSPPPTSPRQTKTAVNQRSQNQRLRNAAATVMKQRKAADVLKPQTPRASQPPSPPPSPPVTQRPSPPPPSTNAPSKIKSAFLATQATKKLQQKAAASIPQKQSAAATKIQARFRMQQARQKLQQKAAADKAAKAVAARKAVPLLKIPSRSVSSRREPIISRSRVTYVKRPPSPGIREKMKIFQGPKPGNDKTGYRMV